MAAPTIPDRSALAGRIQGFGNVNPPPLKEDTGADLAKKAVSNVGNILGEEVMLTVQDFKEKGAVGAMKDAVADAGDILIDGVSGIFGWIRGDPPEEEEHAAAEAASKVLANGPNGAAYGISQASPTGGLNAVWVMPDEADPATLAQLAQESGAVIQPPGAPQIQPYQAPASKSGLAMPAYQPGMQIAPGGPVIQPYQPSGPGGRAGPSPGAFRPPGSQQPFAAPGAPFGVPGAPYGMPGMPGMPAPGAASAGSPQSGIKAYVERIAKGEVLASPEVAQRLVRQCQAVKATAKQLSEAICERARRLYLGLDGGDPSDADAALARILAIVDALAQQEGALAKDAVAQIKSGISEELTSLKSSAKHQGSALPMLQRLGLIKGGAAKPAESVDLLGGGPAAAPAATADLLGTSAPAAAVEADLLGTGGGSTTDSALGGLFDAGAPSPAPVPAADQSLAGLNLDFSAPAPVATAVPPAGAMPGTMAAGATMPQETKGGDAFSFVGAELSKAGSSPSNGNPLVSVK